MKATDLKKPSARRTSLRKVLRKNKKIKVNVAQSANRLTSVNRVLKQGHIAIIPLQNMKDAIVQNEDVELKVAQAAQDLNKVNAELDKEVTIREGIESELADTKAIVTDLRDDLSKIRAKEEETRKIALQDALTKLPNRVLFEQILDKVLDQAKRNHWELALLFMDIDNFKHFNDQYGHDIGDKVLLMVANRLQACVRDEDTCCRWGGDEFICLLLEVKQEVDVIQIADKVGKHIAKPWEFNEAVYSVTVNIGIAIYPTDGETADILFKNADKAMYNAKRTKKGVRLFRESTLD